MKKKLALALSIVMACGMALAGCNSTSQQTSTADDAADQAVESTAADSNVKKGGMEGGTSLSFTTGGDQGTYYGFGGVLAGKVSEATSTSVAAITSGGSQANIEALDAGDAELAFVQSDVMSYAYDGTRLFEEIGKMDGFSTVAALYMEQLQIVTVDPSIKSVEDLKGKNVSIGAAGSGTYFNALDVLEAYGLTEADINPTYQSFGDSAEALQDGKIDAAFIVAGAPTTAVTSLATSKEINILSLDDEHIASLIEESPFYSENTIPADAYGTAEDIKTVAVGAVVIARDDVSEADVYNFMYGVFENIDAIKEAHAKGEELDLEFASSVTSVPYHAGAAKYFEEKGITVQTK
ncbi:MAG: TAXI family TRAP transporter solute-binding subunit [Lachnospiraceae bacterium]|nr:TAXI family TRAP transporter solute-binding subunit [Lachnospiraceae bacterium]